MVNSLVSPAIHNNEKISLAHQFPLNQEAPSVYAYGRN